MTDWLGEYTEAIRTGEIVAGAELKQLLSMLEADRRSGKYLYDTRAAEKRIHFMESCVRLTKAPFYGKPMKALLWQKAFTEAFYSFKMLDGRDRFWFSLLLCGRKNAKSEFCSGIILSEGVVGEPGQEIVCASNDEPQAAILYEATDVMRQMIDPNNKDTHRNNRWILIREKNTKIIKMSQAMKNKEGKNPDFAVVDEAHEMRDKTIIKSIELGQSAKLNPKLIVITTEGFTNNGYLDNELIYARKILAGEIDDEASERYLPWLYTQDSEEEVWQDESSWQKSNPSLDIIKQRIFLRGQLAKAKESKPDRVFVLCKDFNIKQPVGVAWLNEDDYLYDATFDIEDFRGAVCLGAADLAETTDLTCTKALVMRADDPHKYVITMYWIPEAKLEKSPDKATGAKYLEWKKQGYLTVLPGNDTDLAVVADWFVSLRKEYGLRTYKVGYDQKFAKQFTSRLDDWGIEHEVIAQNAETLSNAIKLTEADLQGRILNLNNNPIDHWTLKNASLKVDGPGRALIVKPLGKVAARIDGAVCLAILEEVFRRHRSEFMAMLKK